MLQTVGTASLLGIAVSLLLASVATATPGRTRHRSAESMGFALPARPLRTRQLGGTLCSMSGLSNVRDSTAVYAVGKPTADTILAGPGVVGSRLRPMRPADLSVYGQILNLDTLAGADAQRVQRTLRLRHSPKVVIVPWGYDPGCSTDFWRGSARWATPDSAGLFSLHLRPDSLWVGGYPTFDALYASVRSYVPALHGEVLRRGLVGTPLESDRLLTAWEVFDIYIRLPTRFDPPDTTTVASLRDWVQAHPGHRNRYPGNYILQHWAPRAR